MDKFWTGFLGLIAFLWIVQGLRAGLGMIRLPRLRNVLPLPDADCPTVSILFSARDEAEKLPRALATLLALDYPHYEVVAVNDRSSDETGAILDGFAARDSRLKVIHLRELPAGWLGKPHGLQRAYEASSGEWLIFTDADVRFAPDVLRRSLAMARERGWDHLTLLGAVDMHGFWEKVVLSFFMLSFTLFSEAWRVSDPLSGRYCGVGSFQLVRRSAYEAFGGHAPLKMEVIDDMKLGKLVKLAGFRSGVGVAGEAVAVRWHAGVGNIIRGTTKNFFAGANFRLSVAVAQTVALLAFYGAPLAGLFFASGIGLAFAAIGWAIPVCMEAVSARVAGASALYGLTQPLGALVFIYMLVNSTVVTLWQGGIVWRDTFYPLKELRKGLV